MPCNTMAQQLLDVLLTIFIEQEVTKSRNIQEIFDEFKILPSIQRKLSL